MSSHMSFYRYLIQSAADLHSATWNRRCAKAQDNNKDAFCYEIDKSFSQFSELNLFFAEKINSNDFVILYSHQVEFIKLQNHKNFYIKMTDLEDEDAIQVIQSAQLSQNLLFSPLNTRQLKKMVSFYKSHQNQLNIRWRFYPYNANLARSITIQDIAACDIEFKTIPGLEIHNSNVPLHYELLPEKMVSYRIKWSQQVSDQKPKLSIIIPTYNNSLFLSNVLLHLYNQNCSAELYEILIADDGSHDSSAEITQEMFSRFDRKVNIKYIYWSKDHPHRGSQHFFRSGLARNLAAKYSRGESLLFLDSDMLVPENFVNIALEQLEKYDLIQFQRFHIKQEISLKSPVYSQINLNQDTYIEESHYWSQLFFQPTWEGLENHWKYTCTYALGLKREEFYKMGLFKKYYISYGFEDTDLGYELFKRGLKFGLVKTPLLHLTAYDQMQYKNSARRRVKLLRVTAELFYLQHLDRRIYHLLGDYYRFQKPFKSVVRDLFS